MRVLSLVFAFSFSLVPALTAVAQPVDIEDVRAIAFDKGIVKLDEVELDDGIWEVEGRDASGQEIEMEVEAASGQIIKLKRD